MLASPANQYYYTHNNSKQSHNTNHHAANPHFNSTSNNPIGNNAMNTSSVQHHTQDYKEPTIPVVPYQSYQPQQLQQQPLPSIFIQSFQPSHEVSNGYSNQVIQYNLANPPAFPFDYSQYTYQQPSAQQQRGYSTLPVASYNYNTHNNNNNHLSSPQKYPISPVSLSDKEHNNSVSSTSSVSSISSYSKYPQAYQPIPPPSTSNIDYSSLVSYTISPSLKRKRRKRTTDAAPSTHGVLESYPCDVCNKVFQKPYNLKSHMKTHSTEKPFQCSHCTKTFARSHDKKRHELLHQGVKNFKCEGYLHDGITKWGCGKKFARSDALSRHFRTETGWLCIRPLMDEAKRLDQEAGVNHGSNVPFNVGVLATQLDSEYNNEKNDELYDNSSFIRRLIQER